MGTNLQAIEKSNIHLEGRCQTYLRTVYAAARSLDRLERRQQHNDTIQDIRLQRQAYHLTQRLIDHGTPHNDHHYANCPITARRRN